MNRPLSTTAALAGLLPAGIGALTAPPPALAALVGLGLAVGLITGVGVALVRGPGAPAWPIGWVAAGVATEAGLALAGVLVVLGPASVAVLPAVFLLAGPGWLIATGAGALPAGGAAGLGSPSR